MDLPLTCKQPQTISTVSGTAFEDLPGKRETTFISFESRSYLLYVTYMKKNDYVHLFNNYSSSPNGL